MKNPPTAVIVDLNGQPFSDFDRASVLRDLLARETGAAYRVDRNQSGIGFVVRRAVKDYSSENIRSVQRNVTVNDHQFTGDRKFTPWVLRPALRTRLPIYLPLMLLGLYLFGNPVSILSFTNSLLPLGIGTGWLMSAVRWIGILLLLSSLWSVFVPWIASRYIVSADGIAMEHGIIARNGVQIRYRDIRSVGLKQGLIERLFNVGTVEFAAAGTDDVDITFVGIAGPVAIRAAVQKILDER